MAYKKKTRMYEPWGYREENEYQGSSTMLENDLSSFFTSAEYNKNDGYIHFKNKDGEEIGKLDTSDFSSEGKVISNIAYDSNSQKITITYTNGSSVSVPINGVQSEIERVEGEVDTETNRAKAKEQEIDNKITEHTSNEEIHVTASEKETWNNKLDEATVSSLFGYSEYDSDTLRINFYHSSADTTPISFIDASDFVKDGMVDSVEIKTIMSGDVEVTVLEIVFNTDAGKETIDIPIDDLFDASDYYKKDEIDEKLADEESARISADTALVEAIEAEKSERISSYTELEDSLVSKLSALREALNAETSARESGDTKLYQMITSAETSFEERISALTSSLNSEISRLDTTISELDGKDIASGNVAEDATLSLTRNNGDIITFSSADNVNFVAGEF